MPVIPTAGYAVGKAIATSRKQKPRANGAGFSSDWILYSGQMTESIQSASWRFGMLPILVAATWPSLKIIKVGMPRTP